MTNFRYPDDPRPPQREWASNDDEGVEVPVVAFAAAVAVALIVAGVGLGWLIWGMGQ